MLFGCFIFQSLGAARRSLSFNVSASVEDQGVTNEGDRGAQTSAEQCHVPAEEQLRNECENLWQELNNVS